MANPILIDIMLWDNDPEGTLRCELNSKDLILYRISRAELSSMRNHQELKQCGIYFLFGEESGKPVVYIGQANFRKNMKGVLGRVEEHDKPSEPYWDTAVMAVSKSDSIGATELNYLENQCVEKTSNAGRYTLKNSNSPTIGKVSTKTQILMDGFIDDIAVIFKQVFSYQIFVSDVKVHQSSGAKYYIKRDSQTPGRSCDAVGEIRGNQFVVLAGSKLCTVATVSGPKAAGNSRAKYAKYISKNGDLKCDAVFDSPSGASKFVLYSSTNGNVEWKDKNGVSLGQM